MEALSPEGGDGNDGWNGVFRCDLVRLTGHNWVNDSLVQTYSHLICQRSTVADTGTYPRLINLDTNVYQNFFSDTGREKVLEWHKETDLFAFDLISLPVHTYNHWAVVIGN